MPIGSDVQNTTYADLRAAREPAKKKKSEKKDKKRKLIRIWDIINLNNDVDVFIMGHSHTPEAVIWVDEDQNIKTYVNSGDWVSHTTYVTIEDGITRLRKFEVNDE